jgi:hypothetical protein
LHVNTGAPQDAAGRRRVHGTIAAGPIRGQTEFIHQEITMFRPTRSTVASLAVAASLVLLAACSTLFGGGNSVTLTGANEVPAVATSATGTGTITIAADGSVSGSITVTGMAPTAGHIHQGAVGVNGPVIVPFTQDGNTFTAPAGAKLTETQMAAYRAGNLYVNVHSAGHPAGEIRAQLKAG